MPGAAKLQFDLETARTMVNSFAQASGITCRLLSNTGKLLYRQGATVEEREMLQQILGETAFDDGLHLRGILEAERFGGRYIYDGPYGLTYFCSPILAGNSVAGALVGGPVLISDMDDVLDEIIERWDIPGVQVSPVRSFLATMPQIEPARLNHLSTQLFANAVYIGDSGRELFLARDESRQQRAIGECVHQLKAGGEEREYPIEKEQEMLSAIAQGDRAGASACLNEILGYIFFFIREPEVTQTRVMELLVVLSRAVISGGGDAGLILEVSHRYIQELSRLCSQEEVASWLSQVLNRYIDLVFDLVDSKHKNIIHKAMNYIGLNYTRELTLGEVADHVGYSHSHFSRVFKEETGGSFRACVNFLRVEKSKYYLLSGMSTVSEISGLCGFEDQSYYCKVFKKLVGVTPDQFRKQARRIDRSREYGL